jgi:hypothetical protein
MLRAVLLITSLAAAVAALAFGVFLFTAERGIHGYASVLLPCSFVVASLGGLMAYGAAGPRSTNSEYLHSATSTEETRRIDREDRQRGTSIGLLIFFAGVLTGVVGYVLAELTRR